MIVPLLPFFAEALDAPAWQITLMFAAIRSASSSPSRSGGASPTGSAASRAAGHTALNVVGYLALPSRQHLGGDRRAPVHRLGAGNISPIQGYVADVTPPERRAGRMGLLGAAFGLGFIIGPALGGLLTQPDAGRLGFQIPIFVAAGLAALSCLGVAVFLRESRAKADPAAPRPKFLSGVHEAKANPVIARVLLVTFVYMAAFSGMESTFGRGRRRATAGGRAR